MVACCRTTSQQGTRGIFLIDYDALKLHLRAQIVDKTSALDDVAEAIAHLGYCEEGTQFWTRIANDSSYSVVHRRKCIFALFRRYGGVPSDVAGLAKMLDKPTWLNDSDIEVVTAVTGLIPVHPSPGCTTFRIKVLSDVCSVYLVVMGENIKSATLSRARRDNQAWQVGLQNSIIVEIGLFDEFTAYPAGKELPSASRMGGGSLK